MKQFMHEHPNMTYFIVTTIIIALLGIVISKMMVGEYRIATNMIASIIGGSLVAWKRNHPH